jgi:hypothetical protein
MALLSAASKAQKNPPPVFATMMGVTYFVSMICNFLLAKRGQIYIGVGGKKELGMATPATKTCRRGPGQGEEEAGPGLRPTIGELPSPGFRGQKRSRAQQVAISPDVRGTPRMY